MADKIQEIQKNELALSPTEISYKMVEQKLYDPRLLPQVLAIANTASLHTAKKIIELLKRNIVGSVYIPHSGEHGYDTSHDKLREGILEILEILIKELEVMSNG